MRSPITSGRRVAALLCSVVVLLVVLIAPVLYGQTQPFKVLVYSEIPADQDFHREAIDAGVNAIKQLGQDNNFQVDTFIDLNATQDSVPIFTAANLNQYAAVIFLSPNGGLLGSAQEAAFQAYIEAGHGFVGIHGALSFERQWVWYRQLIGANVGTHTGPGGAPPISNATINVVDGSHQSTQGLPPSSQRNDEWYNLDYAGPPVVTVTTTPLIKVDETTYSGGNMNNNHPVSWYQTFDGGRSFVTTMGHTSESYAEPNFLKHLLGGIEWAAGRASTPPASPSSSAAPSSGASPSAVPSASPSAAPLPGRTLPPRSFVPFVQH